MKAIILAGGLGTRLSEETHLKPKPMIEIGGMPILWHLLKIYSQYNVTEFIICCGYKGNVIKEYFANYFLFTSDVTIDVKNNHVEIHDRKTEPWKITLVDTGEETLTGGRLLRVKKYIEKDETFHFTYGDGLSDVNINALESFHKSHGELATLTAVLPPGRYGSLELDDDDVKRFIEKPSGDGGFINGGFFVLNEGVLDYIQGDTTSWEFDTLPKIAAQGSLKAYKHKGFWQAMDTLRDKQYLESQWKTRQPKWKIW